MLAAVIVVANEDNGDRYTLTINTPMVPAVVRTSLYTTDETLLVKWRFCMTFYLSLGKGSQKN